MARRSESTWVIGVLAAGLLGCQQDKPKSCPSEAFIAAVHASAFYFEHGPVVRGVETFEQARALRAVPVDSISEQVLARLQTLSRNVQRDGGFEGGGPEQVRLLLSEWSCLSTELHDRLHRELSTP
ncbi:MAG: hypothetical protein K1X64_13160 [Myxococcaceae bacterium]|nr:hypothetical protein [Myxococcaceae bacterium]